MEANKIIQEILEDLNLKAPTFAKNIGVKYQRISDIQRGVTKNISRDLAELIVLRYEKYNLSWLLTGEGDMLRSTQSFILDSMKQAMKAPPSDIVKSAILEMQELRDQAAANTVPLLPISAQAGTLNDFIVSIKDNDTERIISPIKGADFAITVSGDSMSPEYTNGSQILIKKINHKSFIEWGKVYVLDTSNGIILKIINECKDNPDCLVCSSINTDQDRYAPFKVPKIEIIAMYRVMLCMSMK